MRTAFEPKAIYLLPGLRDLQSQALDVRLILADFSLQARAQHRKQQRAVPQAPRARTFSVC